MITFILGCVEKLGIKKKRNKFAVELEKNSTTRMKSGQHNQIGNKINRKIRQNCEN